MKLGDVFQVESSQTPLAFISAQVKAPEEMRANGVRAFRKRHFCVGRNKA